MNGKSDNRTHSALLSLFDFGKLYARTNCEIKHQSVKPRLSRQSNIAIPLPLRQRSSPLALMCGASVTPPGTGAPLLSQFLHGSRWQPRRPSPCREPGRASRSSQPLAGPLPHSPIVSMNPVTFHRQGHPTPRACPDWATRPGLFEN